MFFRNLTLFRVPSDVCADVCERLEEAVGALPLREPGPLELATSGFVPPVGRTGKSLVHWGGDFNSPDSCAAVCIGTWEKILPAAVVGEFLARKISDIQEREDRRVGAIERKRIKEAVVTELMAKAFMRPSRQLAYLDFRNGWLAVDTGSRSAAEGVVSALREALGQFPVTPMAPAESPRAIMTDWLINKRTPSTIKFGDEAELRDPVESGAAVRVTRQELEADEVQEHLKTGKQVYRLGIEYAERMSFVLAEDLVVRKLRFLDVVLDELGEESSESMQAEFDARFALLTLELARLFESFADWFGIGENPAMRLDPPPTPKAMRGPRSGEREVRIAADLYKARDDARRLLGERYASTMSEIAKHIRAELPQHGNDALRAAIALAGRRVGGVLEQRWVLAAAVEMLEPSATT